MTARPVQTGADHARAALRPTAEPPGPDEAWTVLRMMLWSARYLEGKGVDRARLDAEHLLAHALGVDRLQLYLQFDRPLAPEELDRFRPLLKRRAAREPLQYIRGQAAFRDLDLAVDPRVLIPRPETEGLVDLVLDWARATGRAGLTAWDVGTGSGAIAISLLREGPFARVVASDASEDSLEVARSNAAKEGVVAEWRLGKSYGPGRPGERFDVVVSNPPYVATAERAGLEPEVGDWEPASALMGGEDGLDVVRELMAGASDVLGPAGLLALEIGASQGPAAAALARAAPGLAHERLVKDLSGRDRYLLAERVD